MRILFINANLSGHINPTLGLVRQLTQSGHDVDYFCAEAFAAQVAAAGARHIGFGESLKRFLREYRPTDRHPFFLLMEYALQYDEAALPELLSVLAQGDYNLVLCDSLFGGAPFLRQLTSVPVVCSHASFAMRKAPVPERMLTPGFHPQLDGCYETLRRICARYRIAEPTLEAAFTGGCERNLVYTTQRFNGDEDAREPEYLFVGPTTVLRQENCDLDFSALRGRKVLYIALGSLNTDFAPFYRTCLDAFGNTEYAVFLSVGGKCDPADLGIVPDNFVVGGLLPQLAILRHADAFITHAGFNSVNEALYFGVPMLALPLMNDQPRVARRIVSLELGLSAVMQDLTAEALKTQTETVLNSEAFRRNARALSAEMWSANQLERAVKELALLAEPKKGK